MAKSWKELKSELEAETRKIMTTCPDEIKRFHYGIIIHSQAGKYNLNQYFGHMDHAYDYYVSYLDYVFPSIRRLAMDPDFELKHLKNWFVGSIAWSAAMFEEYGGQKSLNKYVAEMVGVFNTVQTKEEFVELLGAFNAYASRLRDWFYWYFPWGIGASVFQRVSPEDIKEIKRLGKIS